MFEAKCLRYVAIPTNWQVSLQNSRCFFRFDFLPLNQFAILSSESRSMINPLNLFKLLATIDAFLSSVPSHQQAAD
jgi:hypothetical protein